MPLKVSIFFFSSKNPLRLYLLGFFCCCYLSIPYFLTHNHMHIHPHTIQFLDNTVGWHGHALYHAEVAGINSNQARTGKSRSMLHHSWSHSNKKHPHLYAALCMNTLSGVTHNMSTRAVVKSLGCRTEFCLLHISGVVDINTMLIKPLTPSFTCLFHFAEYFKQPWGAANTVAHNENMFVKIKSIVVSVSKASVKMQYTLTII